MANSNYVEKIVNQRQAAMGQILFGATKPLEEFKEGEVLPQPGDNGPVINVEGAQYSPSDWEKIINFADDWERTIYRKGLQQIDGQPNPDYDPAYEGALPKVSVVVAAKKTQGGQDVQSYTFSSSGQEERGVEIETVRTATLGGINPQQVETTDHSIVQVISTGRISPDKLLAQPGQFADSNDLIKAGELAQRIDSGQVLIQGIYMKKPPEIVQPQTVEPVKVVSAPTPPLGNLGPASFYQAINIEYDKDFNKDRNN